MARRTVGAVAGLAVAVLASLPAGAQTATPSSAAPGAAPFAGPGQFIARQPSTSLRLSQMKGVDLIGQDHTKLGDIDDLLIDQTGRIQAVVVDTSGLLGIGGKTVAIPYEQIVWNTGEVSRVQTPSASLHPADAPMAPTGQAMDTAIQRMPGAEVSDRALSAVPEGRSGVVDPSTGPVTTGATNRPATVPVVGSGGPERAFARLTKADLEQAPAFRYAGRGDAQK